MKINYKAALPAAVIFTAISASAQNFQDLNFESANVPATGFEPYGSYSVSVTSALPGWTAYLGGQEITQMSYNSPTLSVATVCLIGPTWDSSGLASSGVGIIDGNYSLDLETGITPLNPTTTYVNASIEQYGTVPSTAKSLEFKEAEGPLTVSFNGNVLVPVALSTGVSADGLPYTLYGADISAWVGQTGELEFATSSDVDYAYAELDDISFSTTEVPEPSPFFLVGIGLPLFAAGNRLHERVSEREK